MALKFLSPAQNISNFYIFNNIRLKLDYPTCCGFIKLKGLYMFCN